MDDDALDLLDGLPAVGRGRRPADDARLDLDRLRRAVREKRAQLYNQQTARYIACSRRWTSTSSAGD